MYINEFARKQKIVPNNTILHREYNKEQYWVAFISQPYYVEVKVEVETEAEVKVGFRWGWVEV